MTLKGFLTNLLSERSKSLGYELMEDEDFLYLHKNGVRVAIFSSYGVRVSDVEGYISRKEG